MPPWCCRRLHGLGLVCVHLSYQGHRHRQHSPPHRIDRHGRINGAAGQATPHTQGANALIKPCGKRPGAVPYCQRAGWVNARPLVSCYRRLLYVDDRTPPPRRRDSLPFGWLAGWLLLVSLDSGTPAAAPPHLLPPATCLCGVKGRGRVLRLARSQSRSIARAFWGRGGAAAPRSIGAIGSPSPRRPRTSTGRPCAWGTAPMVPCRWHRSGGRPPQARISAAGEARAAGSKPAPKSTRRQRLFASSGRQARPRREQAVRGGVLGAPTAVDRRHQPARAAGTHRSLRTDWTDPKGFVLCAWRRRTRDERRSTERRSELLARIVRRPASL